MKKEYHFISFVFFSFYLFQNLTNFDIDSYRRICYGFQTQTEEMYEVSFFETSSVLDETGIFMNGSIGGADGDQMKTC